MKNIFYKPILLILLTSIIFVSCSKDDDVEYITETITETVIVTETQTVNVEVPVTVNVEVPYSYEFARAGKATVSFSGQTARLNMADEIYSALNKNTFTKSQLMTMFNDGTGFFI